MKNIVHLIDCMEFMKTCKDNQYDLAICDPPYGIYSEKKQTGFKKEYNVQAQANKWDVKPSKEYFEELFRISKNQIIWGMQYFTDMLPAFSQLIIWDKKTGKNFFADGEAAFCSIPGTLRIFTHQWVGMFKASEVGKKAIQPAQKPIALYKWLLRRYAKIGWTIFDSHEGSGSNRIACYDLGFVHEGCEKNKSYWEAQEERYIKHIKKRSGGIFDSSVLSEIEYDLFKDS